MRARQAGIDAWGNSPVNGNVVIVERQIGLAKFHSVLAIWPWASGLELKRVWGDIKQKRTSGDCFGQSRRK